MKFVGPDIRTRYLGRDNVERGPSCDCGQHLLRFSTDRFQMEGKSGELLITKKVRERERREREKERERSGQKEHKKEGFMEQGFFWEGRSGRCAVSGRLGVS